MTVLDLISSPCFVLEEAKLQRNLELLAQVQREAGIKIILALKGFAMFSAFPLIRQYLPGTTASSLHEAMLGKEEFGGELHTYAPAYRDEEFDEIVRYSSHITFNSLNQWERFRERVPPQVSAGLRLNPEYSPVTHEIYNPCSPASRLGIPASQLEEGLPPGIEGLHCHNLCESDSLALEKTLIQIEKLFGHLLGDIKWLNLGGGHLMTASWYDVPHLIQLLRSFQAKYPHLEIILEPGSAVVWETGFLLATVLDSLETGAFTTLMLDISFTAHLPDCLEMPYTPRVRGVNIEPAGKYRLGGLTCLAGDFLGNYSFPSPPKIGDRLIFEDMIHYTMVKTNTFNGVPHPSLGIIRTDGSFSLIRSFGYQDYKCRLS